MKTKTVLGATCCIISLITLASAETPEQIKLSDIFGSSILGNQVVIQLGKSSTLVIDDEKSPYYLEGKDIIIRASRIRIMGHPIIQAFSPDNVAKATEGVPTTPSQAPPLTHGTKGEIGKKGETGKKAGVSLFDFSEIVVSDGADLNIVMRGQIGGKGQKGGQGGQGGIGAEGLAASVDNPRCTSRCPETGGKGATGGPRGAGGQGGDGGQGGTVYLSENAKKAASGNPAAIRVVVQGGPGGATGEPGEPGIGGPGGPRGQGGNCICNNPPGPGPIGDAGGPASEVTPPSSIGKDGAIAPLP